jgi:hypothetical protein
MVEDQQAFQADRAALDHHGGFENAKILARASISPPGRQTRISAAVGTIRDPEPRGSDQDVHDIRLGTLSTRRTCSLHASVSSAAMSSPA